MILILESKLCPILEGIPAIKTLARFAAHLYLATFVLPNSITTTKLQPLAQFLPFSKFFIASRVISDSVGELDNTAISNMTVSIFNRPGVARAVL